MDVQTKEWVSAAEKDRSSFIGSQKQCDEMDEKGVQDPRESGQRWPPERVD